MVRIPTTAANAKMVLKEDYNSEWDDLAPETFRDKVAKLLGLWSFCVYIIIIFLKYFLVDKAVAGICDADATKTKQRLYRNMFDKNTPKTDYGIFLTNALPLR